VPDSFRFVLGPGRHWPSLTLVTWAVENGKRYPAGRPSVIEIKGIDSISKCLGCLGRGMEYLGIGKVEVFALKGKLPTNRLSNMFFLALALALALETPVDSFKYIAMHDTRVVVLRIICIFLLGGTCCLV
jgi:hypothetical protein